MAVELVAGFWFASGRFRPASMRGVLAWTVPCGLSACFDRWWPDLNLADFAWHIDLDQCANNTFD